MRLGGHIESVDQGQQPGTENKNQDNSQETPHADTAGAHGCDFAVSREATEANQDTYQDAHWNRVGKGDGHGEKEDLRHARQGGAVADDQLQDAFQIARKQDKREHRHAN